MPLQQTGVGYLAKTDEIMESPLQVRSNPMSATASSPVGTMTFEPMRLHSSFGAHPDGQEA